MAHTKSAMKRMRQNAKRQARNRAARSKLRTQMKKFVVAEETKQDVEKTLSESVRALDKAASKGLIHKRTASRRKSRLAKRANKALAAAKTEA